MVTMNVLNFVFVPRLQSVEFVYSLNQLIQSVANRDRCGHIDQPKNSPQRLILKILGKARQKNLLVNLRVRTLDVGEDCSSTGDILNEWG